jgi:ribosome biogenesis GTPase A
MAAGIPNVGKSTFINSFSGSSSLKTGNKPGVTKGKQWIRISKEVELMDTPGLLWPKFEDQSVGLKIALIGSMPDTILNTEELSLELIQVLAKRYEGALAARYGIDEGVLSGYHPLAGRAGTEAHDACDVQEREIRNPHDARGVCDIRDTHDAGDRMAEVSVLTEIAKNRGCLKKGGEPDTEKAALLLLDDFRSGRLGRMSLESPEEMAK